MSSSFFVIEKTFNESLFIGILQGGREGVNYSL